MTEVADDPLLAVVDDLARYEFDPRGFVRWAFPWGVVGTPLEHETGPDDWQDQVLARIGERLRAGGDRGAVVLEAIRAGHGVGKSALVSWLILWALSTHELTRGTVTAMTEPQLRTKTWAELAKWHGMFVARDLFELLSRSLSFRDESLSRSWRIDAVPWSTANASAFAGMHNKGRRILLLFDEAAEIDDVIWDVAEGALTDKHTQIVWVVLGNPITVSGRFAEAFRTGGRRWATTTVDAQTSKFSNKGLIDVWRSEYGEDSDFFRVRVKGLPPRAGVNNFIPAEWIEQARGRDPEARDYMGWPKVIGVDPARFGDDESVLTVRQGSKVLLQRGFSGLDGPNLAAQVVDLWRNTPGVASVCVDGIGIGASCVDALRRVPGMDRVLVDVNVAMPARDDRTYHNLRAEVWARLREWLRTGAIPDDARLAQQLLDVKFGMDSRARIQLESKRDIKARGAESPDRADSLALTFVGDTIAVAKDMAAGRAVAPVRRQVVWGRRG